MDWGKWDAYWRKCLSSTGGVIWKREPARRLAASRAPRCCTLRAVRALRSLIRVRVHTETSIIPHVTRTTHAKRCTHSYVSEVSIEVSLPVLWCVPFVCLAQQMATSQRMSTCTTTGRQYEENLPSDFKGTTRIALINRNNRLTARYIRVDSTW